jgi:hypothetical protein
MLEHTDGKLTRIGVFYDGGYFAAVSDYYRYCHQRKSRVSITGLHEFLKHKVAEAERVEERYCQSMDAHYFRGRFSADEADQPSKLPDERKFDDILTKAVIITQDRTTARQVFLIGRESRQMPQRTPDTHQHARLDAMQPAIKPEPICLTALRCMHGAKHGRLGTKQCVNASNQATIVE